MIVPMSRQEREKTTSIFEVNRLDRNPVIGIKIIVVSKKAVVSHWTWVAFRLNSRMMVG